MGDNVVLNSMSGGDSVGADDISGIKYQRNKLIEGADGVNDGDISASNGLPTEGAQTTKTATIANGAAVSGEVDLAGFKNFAIMMPASWTTANLTFQGSNTTGGTFVDIYDSAGNELTIIAAASRMITDIPELAPFRYIKVRSGTTGTPVNQGGSRDLTIICKG